MSLRAKLISAISAFCLVIALLVVGVIAVSPANVNMGGNISFGAKDVLATIDATVTGTEEEHPFTTIKFDEKTADDQATNSSWTGLNFKFASKTSLVTLTITIKNDSDERAFTVAYTAPTAINNVTVASTYSVGEAKDQALTEAPISVEKGQTATIKVTFDITDEAKSAGGTWNIGMILTNVEAQA